MLTAMLNQKPAPDRSSAGSTANIGKLGRMNQKAPIDSSAMRAESPVSRDSHSIASNDVSGSEATSPPQPGYRRAISETAATMMPESAALMTRYSMARALTASPHTKEGPPIRGQAAQ